MLEPEVLELNHFDIHSIVDTARYFSLQYDERDLEDPTNLDSIKLAAPGVTDRVRRTILRFTRNTTNGLLLIKGLSINDEKIGPTPFGATPSRAPTAQQNAILLVLSSLYLEPMGWASYLDGRIVHNLAAKKGRENTQTSEGTEPLELHTEEAFHPFRPDAFALMGMRNHDNIPTHLVQVSDLNISDNTREWLKRQLYYIRQDEAHEDGFYKEPDPVPVLDGHRFRYDPAYTTMYSTGAADAFMRLQTEIDKNVQQISLAPGDILFVNNDITVHGRAGYAAKYDGTDRWLKRVWLTRDLTKSRSIRKNDSSRVLY